MSRFFYFLLFLLFFQNVADVYLTNETFKSGGVEGNPLVAPHLGNTIEPHEVAIKLSVVLIADLAFYICMRTAKKRGETFAQNFVWGIVCAVIILYGVILLNNWDVLAKLRMGHGNV